MPLPDGAVVPSMFGLPDEGIEEVYYAALAGLFFEVRLTGRPVGAVPAREIPPPNGSSRPIMLKHPASVPPTRP